MVRARLAKKVIRRVRRTRAKHPELTYREAASRCGYRYSQDEWVAIALLVARRIVRPWFAMIREGKARAAGREA
ncbi:hypothetical protein EBU60_04620 [bacterium]|nr:hypothetical protein [bacterium]